MMFCYSKGKNKYDNLPQQLQVTSFKKFAQDVINSVDTQKGGTYVCAAVACGFHKDTKKYPEEGHWRQQHLALPRRFLAFDFDGFEKSEVWEELLDIFPWKAFFYTTSSHTTEKPRARAFVELSRDVDHDQGVELGEAAQAYIETLISTGWIKFDESVYRSTQPIYTPVRGFLPYAVKGEILDVDHIITWNRANKAIKVFNQPKVSNTTNVEFNSLLSGNAEITKPIPSGQRNATLLSLAGRYRAHGHTQREIKQLVLKDNERWCNPPLDENEVLSIVRRYEHQTKAKECTDSILKKEATTSNENISLSEQQYRFLTPKQIKELPPLAWLVKGLLPETGLASVYGPSGSGKSFFIIDLIARIALGEEFYGNKVKACPVIYVPLEGTGGVPNRIKAYEKHFNTQLPSTFRIVTERISLLTTDTVCFAEAINQNGFQDGVIVIDTLNQSAPEADENTSSDMGTIIKNAQILQKATNSLVILVHHTGKDASRGARGHSSFFAALDAAIELKNTPSGREWMVSKSKDGEDGISYPFQLEQVFLGKDEDGEDITSCVVQPDIFRAELPKSPQGKNQKAVLAHLKATMDSTHKTKAEMVLIAKEAISGTNQMTRAKEVVDKLIELGHLVDAGDKYYLYDSLEKNLARFRSPYRGTEKTEKEPELEFSENEIKRETEKSPIMRSCVELEAGTLLGP